MICLAPNCKDKAAIEIKIIKGRLEQKFGFCFPHASLAQTMIDSLVPEQKMVCLCGNEMDYRPMTNGLIPICKECQKDGQFEGEDSLHTCDHCGDEIPEETYQKNGGYCQVCQDEYLERLAAK